MADGGGEGKWVERELRLAWQEMIGKKSGVFENGGGGRGGRRKSGKLSAGNGGRLSKVFQGPENGNGDGFGHIRSSIQSMTRFVRTEPVEPRRRFKICFCFFSFCDSYIEKRQGKGRGLITKPSYLFFKSELVATCSSSLFFSKVCCI